MMINPIGNELYDVSYEALRDALAGVPGVAVYDPDSNSDHVIVTPFTRKGEAAKQPRHLPWCHDRPTIVLTLHDAHVVALPFSTVHEGREIAGGYSVLLSPLDARMNPGPLRFVADTETHLGATLVFPTAEMAINAGALAEASIGDSQRGGLWVTREHYLALGPCVPRKATVAKPEDAAPPASPVEVKKQGVPVEGELAIPPEEFKPDFPQMKPAAADPWKAKRPRGRSLLMP